MRNEIDENQEKKTQKKKWHQPKSKKDQPFLVFIDREIALPGLRKFVSQ